MNWFKLALSPTQQASTLLGKDKSKMQEVKRLTSIAKDPSKHYAYVSYILSKNVNVADAQISRIIQEVQQLLNENKIKTISATPSGITIIDGKNDKYNSDSLIIFQEAIHAIESSYKPLIETNADSLEELKDKIVYEGSNITVYKADGPGDCIALGDGQRFCISRKDSKNMYNTYRNMYQSTFYFIYDKNFKEIEPLSLVVLDAQEYEIKLTDKNNRTGIIDIYERDSNRYLNYLRSKGVPVDNLINNPLSKEEVAEEKKLGKKDENLEWFKELTRDEKNKYISRYHKLSKEQFQEILSDKELLQKYLSFGHPLKLGSVKTLNNNQLSTYKHAREKIIKETKNNIILSDILLFGKEILDGDKNNRIISNILIDEIVNNDLESVKYILDVFEYKIDPIDIQYFIDLTLRHASFRKDYEITKYLLVHLGNSVSAVAIYSILQETITNNDLNTVEFIINNFQDKYYYNGIVYLIDKADRLGHSEIKEYLKSVLAKMKKIEKEDNSNWFKKI